MTSSIDTASKPWRLNSRRALRTILCLVRWRCSAGYGIELSMGCENTASQNMFLNISKCYLNILFVSLIHDPSTTWSATDRVIINGDYLSIGDGGRL